MHLLITGATGFIGKKLVPALSAAGYKVRCAVWKKTPTLDAEQIEVNRLEQNTDWSCALQGVDVVIHLAARVHILNESRASSLAQYCDINAKATKHFAQQAALHGVKRFIFLSTIKVNGEQTHQGAPFTEDDLEKPQDAYAQSKWQAEQYLLDIAKTTSLEVVILRPPLVYGPEVKANFLNMLRWVEKGWPLPFAAIENRRSFIYIDNLISAIMAVTIHEQAKNQIYLVADGEAWSVPSLLKFLAINMETKLRLVHMPLKWLSCLFRVLGKGHLNDRLVHSLEINSIKIKQQLKWNPPVSGQQGLIETIKWYRNRLS